MGYERNPIHGQTKPFFQIPGREGFGRKDMIIKRNALRNKMAMCQKAYIRKKIHYPYAFAFPKQNGLWLNIRAFVHQCQIRCKGGCDIAKLVVAISDLPTA